MVWKLGIPDSWRAARTVPIYKKGDTSDFSNFRPISLLPTMYKIFSGILSQRINRVAVDLGWLSPEQKGFLPGVHGIQEHTQLLQTAVEGAQNKRTHLSLVWLDLCNAFGSVPHAVLAEMFSSLPLPDILRRTLLDIYSGNVINFIVGKDSVTITPHHGVRLGDALSTTVFYLAAEPMIRAVKSSSIPGVMLFGQKVKVTAYADDLAVLCSSPEALQWTLDSLSHVAAVLGLGFNAGKCSCLIIEAGKPFPVSYRSAAWRYGVFVRRITKSILEFRSALSSRFVHQMISSPNLTSCPTHFLLRRQKSWRSWHL